MDNNKITEYFKGVKAEWGKITWPDRKQVIAQTVIVIVIVIAFTIFTFSADIIFKGILDALHLKA